MLARHLINGTIEWKSIHALMPSHLIALDKSPGVHPIGIGKALQQILCKIVAFATCTNLEKVCGVTQLCSGLQAGMEGAIYAVHELLDQHSGDGCELLLVDA